ncbi:hypothetical protein GCM10010176_026230 [Nonomuraea spiralis]|nr:hypothetical protein GCM10010176_026230 [Nonomuraea spiralis]
MCQPVLVWEVPVPGSATTFVFSVRGWFRPTSETYGRGPYLRYPAEPRMKWVWTQPSGSLVDGIGAA